MGKHLHLRRTRERNQIAARQIEELLAQKEELRKAYRRQPLHPEDAPNEEPPAAQANTSPSAADVKTTAAGSCRWKMPCSPTCPS